MQTDIDDLIFAGSEAAPSDRGTKNRPVRSIPDGAAAVYAWYQRRQIFWAYSRTARSAAKMPLSAMFTRPIRAKPLVSRTAS